MLIVVSWFPTNIYAFSPICECTCACMLSSHGPVLVFLFQRIFHKHFMRNEAVLHSHGSIVSTSFIYLNYSQGYTTQLVVSYHIWIGILLGEKFGLYFIVNTYLDEISCFWHYIAKTSHGPMLFWYIHKYLFSAHLAC